MTKRCVTLLRLYYPLLAVDVPVDIDDGPVKMVFTRRASVHPTGISLHLTLLRVHSPTHPHFLRTLLCIPRFYVFPSPAQFFIPIFLLLAPPALPTPLFFFFFSPFSPSTTSPSSSTSASSLSSSVVTGESRGVSRGVLVPDAPDFFFFRDLLTS